MQDLERVFGTDLLEIATLSFGVNARQYKCC